MMWVMMKGRVGYIGILEVMKRGKKEVHCGDRIGGRGEESTGAIAANKKQPIYLHANENYINKGIKLKKQPTTTTTEGEGGLTYQKKH
jgi:hypothetical protein